MTSQFKTQAEYKNLRDIQSFYDTALIEFLRIYELKKANLRSKGNDARNAAVTRNELIEALAKKEKITQKLAENVVKSLVKSKKIKAFGMYAGNLVPMDGES